MFKTFEKYEQIVTLGHGYVHCNVYSQNNLQSQSSISMYRGLLPN